MEGSINRNQLHIVLGGDGAIGSAVIKELQKRNLNVKTVERTKKVEGTQTINADLLNFEEFDKAVASATHVYLCIGLPYNYVIWKRDWPRIMKNTIEVCKKNGSTLVFIDNVYLYGPAPLSVPFTEEHSKIPSTKKGKARKETVDLMIDAMNLGQIKGVIGRSADFYGPNAKNSPFYIGFLENMLKNKNPQWLGKQDVKHTYAYTEDNARALVELSLNGSTYGQVWHLPAGKPVTIQEILDIFNKNLNTDFKIGYMPRFLLNMLSLTIPILKEVKEMVYQFYEPYVLSFEKFKQKFPDFKLTAYDSGISKMVESFR